MQAIKQIVKQALRSIPYIRGLMETQQNAGLFPPGHFYSPIPDRAEVQEYIARRTGQVESIPGIDLRREYQLQLLEEYACFYPELPFPEHKCDTHRYYYEGVQFSYADSIILYCFLRKRRPRRIIEVGSGSSSALILDTVDLFPDEWPEITFIEPHTASLRGFLRPGDLSRVRLLEQRLQTVSPTLFTELQPGDFLLIDSSHVLKCGSDLHYLFEEILPVIRPGVFVHFHDVFFPFDYPDEWLLQGRYWNENYFLRAFLQYNSHWAIDFFNSYARVAFRDFLQHRMPLCLKNHGGSLYLERVR